MLHLKEFLPGLRPGIALDLGTRFGEFAYTLLEAMPAGSRVIGVDWDAKTVEQAREKNAGKGIEFQKGDAAHLEFADGSCELVALSNTLHHIEAYDQVLDEMLRVLRPGGTLLINEMFSECENEAQEAHFAQHTLEARIDMLTGEYQRATWKKDEIVRILERLPLEDVRMAEFREEPEMDAKLATKTPKLKEKVEKAAKGKDCYDELMAEAERVQQLVARVGIQRCMQLVYVGKKK